MGPKEQYYYHVFGGAADHGKGKFWVLFPSFKCIVSARSLKAATQAIQYSYLQKVVGHGHTGVVR